jgi:hypothetical protein
VKKSARLDNKKVQDWAIFVKQKKGARLGKKGARLDNSRHILAIEPPIQQIMALFLNQFLNLE